MYKKLDLSVKTNILYETRNEILPDRIIDVHFKE